MAPDAEITVPEDFSASVVAFDLNAILHSQLRRAQDEEHAITLVFSRLHATLRHVRPESVVLLAVDGPAPVAPPRSGRKQRAKAAGQRKAWGGPVDTSLYASPAAVRPVAGRSATAFERECDSFEQLLVDAGDASERMADRRKKLADDVNRAFRKRSLHCHPDKSRHPDAPRAFDLLKKAKACLLSDLEREAYIRDHVKMQQTLWEGSWKSDREAAEARERIASARCNAQEEQTALVVDAMKRRRDKAQSAERKKQRSALRAHSAV